MDETVLTSHDVSGILNSKVNIWMTDSRLLKYQSLLLERPVTKLKVCKNLNPATFLPEKKNKTPDHDCSQFLTLNYAARKDLKDKLLGLRNTPLFVNERLPVVDVPTPKKKTFSKSVNTFDSNHMRCFFI